VRPSSPRPSWPDIVEVFRVQTFVSRNTWRRALMALMRLLHSGGSDKRQRRHAICVDVVVYGNVLRTPCENNRQTFGICQQPGGLYDWAKAKTCMDERNALENNLCNGWVHDSQGLAGARRFPFCRKVFWNVTIVRPGFIWGARTKQRSLEWEGSSAGYILLFGPFTRLPLSYVDNCADCLLAAVENPARVRRNLQYH